MLNKYSLVIVLYTAIFIGIIYADDVKQHDVVDGDNRNALRNLFTDTFSNMRQLLRQNITINHINLKDDSNVKFHNLSVTKLPKSRDTRSQLIVECLVNNQLKIIIPLGYYELAGSFETTNDSKIHPFVIFKNIDANITLNLNSQKTVEHIDILIPKSEKPIHEIAATLNPQTSAIKAQILDQLFAQIKKDDLLSYFATAKNYCFHSHCDARHADQHYLINQTHAIQVNQKNITVEWIKIHDFYFNFTFKLDDFNNEIDYYYGSFNADFTFKGYYTGEKDPKNSTEHRGKLKSAELGGIELESGDQGSKTAPDIYADPSNADPFVTRGVGAKLSDIIRDDLLSVIYRKYA